MIAAVRLIVAFAALGVIGWLAVSAQTMARADIAANTASREMGAWAAARYQPQRATWDSIHETILAAHELSARDPSINELLGVLHVMRRDYAEYQAKGLVHFVQAAVMRPVSAYTWANIAEANYALGHTGESFLMALRRAVKLGPAEPEVQRTVADFGLAVWDELALGERQLVDRMVGAGLRRNPLEMLQISERRGRLALACRHLVGLSRAPDPKWYQLCQSTEATP